MAEAEQGSIAVGLQFEDDGSRAGGYRAVRPFPAPCVDQPARCVYLDEFSARDVTWDHLDSVTAAAAQIKSRGLPHPANDLIGVDKQLPDCLWRGGDENFPLQQLGVSHDVHVSSSPFFLPFALTPRAARSRIPRETSSTRTVLAVARGTDGGFHRDAR